MAEFLGIVIDLLLAVLSQKDSGDLPPVSAQAVADATQALTTLKEVFATVDNSIYDDTSNTWSFDLLAVDFPLPSIPERPFRHMNEYRQRYHGRIQTLQTLIDTFNANAQKPSGDDDPYSLPTHRVTCTYSPDQLQALVDALASYLPEIPTYFEPDPTPEPTLHPGGYLVLAFIATLLITAIAIGQIRYTQIIQP